jgi:hypothetical protein
MKLKSRLLQDASRSLTIKARGAIGCVLILLIATAASAQNGPYKNSFLDGLYFPQDLFTLLNGEGHTGTGARDFDGEESLSSIVTFGTRTPLDYEVRDDGRFRLFDEEIDWGFVGSVGLGGELLAFSPQAARREDLQIPEGYAALRLSTAEGSGYRDSDFEGSYSYHALLFNGDDWFNDYGAIDADGEGRMVLLRQGVAPLLFAYDVASGGRVTINGGSPQAASIAAGGDLLFHVVDVGRNDDPAFPGGYEGLALYVRRQPGDKAVTNAWLRGTYHLHQLRVSTSTTSQAATGTITAGGAFTFFGTLGGADFADRLQVFPTGVFGLPSQSQWTGTLGAGGNVIVVSALTGVPRLQVWLRTAGGVPLPGDRDGDGVRDEREAALGTNLNLADTDGDGLLDNIDARPTTADNRFTAKLDEDEFTVTEGEDAPLETRLVLDSNDFPYFDWSIRSDADWLTITPAEGVGDRELEVLLDPAELSAAESPWIATLTITAPFMQSVSPLEVRINVAPPPVTLQVSPESLRFTAVQGAGPPASQQVALSSPDAATFAWTASTAAPWLTITPASGTGPRTLTAEVDATGLSATAGPFSTTVTFSLAGTTAAAAELDVVLDLLPPRDPGLAWRVSPSSQSQTEIAAGADETKGDWVLAWTESSQIQSLVLAGDGTPRFGPSPLSLAVQGQAERPQAVVAPEGDVAWVIWQQNNAGTVPSIQARRWDLETGGLSAVFGIAGGRTGRSAPHALLNAAGDQLAVVYELAQESGSAIELATLDADSSEALETRIVWQSTDLLRTPRLASSPVGYLLTATLRAADDSESQVYARYLDLSGTPVGDPFRLDAGSAWADEAVPVAVEGSLEAPSAAYPWSVVWRERSSSSALPADYLLGLLDADGIVSRRRAAAGVANGHAQTYSFDSEQSQLAWTGGSGPANILRRRITAGGFLLDTPLAYPQGGAAQAEPAVSCSPVANEFLTLWLDSRHGPAQIYALREDAGSIDEDNDGLPNDWELTYTLDPFNPDGNQGGDGDPDLDGLSNGDEYRTKTDPNNPDSDLDGLWDRQEDRNRDGVLNPGESSPLNQDTDNDGFRDDAEWFLASEADNPASIPPAGLYRIDYAAVEAGVPSPVLLYAVIHEPGTYGLTLNGGWSSPSGWTAAEPTNQEWSRGVHTLEVVITPPSNPDATQLLGEFVFQLVAASPLGKPLTALLALDNHKTINTDVLPASALAKQHAPIVKLHRDEFFRMTPIEVTLNQSRLDRGNTSFLSTRPDFLDLYQSPQVEARVDVDGDSIEDIREDYPEPSLLPPPKLYYTVAEITGPSAAGIPPTGHIALQYYLHFSASDWGFGVRGGQRHEGDWQLVQILLDEQRTPYRVTVSAHGQLAADGGAPGGASAVWEDIEQHDGHPVVYAGQGSHALYFTSGAQRYSTGLDVHDGRGPWAVPWIDDAPLLLADYPDQRSLELEALPRLSEISRPHWLRFAGRWGQDNFPQGEDDSPTPSTRSGPFGPVFMSIPGFGVGPWLDPFAWSRLPEVPERTAGIEGSLPSGYAGMVFVALDGRGQVFRTTVEEDGRFGLALPLSHYQLLIVEQDEAGFETWRATIEYRDSSSRLLPLPEAGVLLGAIVEEEGRLLAANPYVLLDTDGDGLSDAVDPDPDDDGRIASDDDILGDGFVDDFQLQDSDGDLAPACYDNDDDGDEILDEADDDANGDGIPDVDAPVDSDGDGFMDAIDLDADNDGFSNRAEALAGSDPLHYFDTPLLRLGDANGDGDIDAVDLQIMVNSALRVGAYSPRGDFDQDGRIDAGDIQQTVALILNSL